MFSSRTARVMRFCLLLMWGVTLSSSTLLRRQLTPIESIGTRELQDTADNFDAEEETGGSSAVPEVTGTIPAVPAPPPISNEAIPGNGNPDSVINDSGNTPANMAESPDPVINDSGNSPANMADAPANTADAPANTADAPANMADAPANDTAKPVQTNQPVQPTKTVQTNQPVQTPKAVQTAQPVQTPKAVQTAQPIVSPTHSPSHRPTIRPTASPTKAKTVIPQQNYPDEEEGFGAMHALAFVFFGAIIALAIRKRNSIRNLIPADAGARSSKRSGRYQEISTDEQDKDEEWGWDDEPQSPGGGLELNAYTEKKDDDYSLSDSLSSHKEHVDDVVRPKAFPLHHRSSSGERERMSPLNSSKNKVDSPPMHVQKLGTANHQVKKAQPTPPKPKPDDFFADMGFSAKPTFSHAASPPPARQAAPRSAPLPVLGNGSRLQASSTAPSIGSLARPATTTMATPTSLGASALAADSFDDDLGGGTDWDDDGDLDDLLDD